MSNSALLSLPTCVSLPIIGYIRSPLTQKFGIPRQPNLVDVPIRLDLIAPYNDPLAVVGLENFSHIWVVWQFHQNKNSDMAHLPPKFRPQVRPPRLGGNDKLGVFATRSMYRPAPIGLSVVKLDNIILNHNQVSLQLLGGDMVDGTPVLDIKPYIAYSDCLTEAHSGFAMHQPAQKHVTITDSVSQQLADAPFTTLLVAQDPAIICQLIAQDPRPAYRQQEYQTRFTLQYRGVDCTFFQQDADTLVWCDIQLV